MNRKLLCCALAFAWIAGCGGGSNNNNNTTPASITATTGSGQSANISTAFASPLAATVLNSSGSPVSGVTVTFAAPSSGASGTFAGGANTATTNSSGVATSAAFTANATAGAYSVTASVSGVSTPASFSLTNNAGTAASITPTSGTPQSAQFNTAFAAPLAAVVKDGSGNPVAGVTVTFTAPGTGASGAFTGAVNTATTDQTGTATAPVFTANASVGSYTVTATVSGVTTPASFALTNNGVYYSYSGSGVDDNYELYAVAGSVLLDGNGNVLGGEQDYNDGDIVDVQDAITPAPASTLAVDPTTGLATLTVQLANTNNITTPPGVSGLETFAVQFVNAKHALLTQFDGTAMSLGTMDFQTLSTQVSAGGYAFALSGLDNDGYAAIAGGVFTVTAGSGSSSPSLSGTLDSNDPHNYNANISTIGLPLTGTLPSSPDSFGRGTMSITVTPTGGTPTTTNFAYYIVGPEVLRIIETDAGPMLAGSAFGQGTAANSFGDQSLGALNSSSLFVLNGNFYGYDYDAVGSLTVGAPTTGPDITGTFTGIGDANGWGWPILTAQQTAGTYSIASNGYGNFTFAGNSDISSDLGPLYNFGIYLTDPNLNLNDPNNTTANGLGSALVVELDDNWALATGTIAPQTTASFAGNYAFGGLTYLNSWAYYFVGQGSVSPSSSSSQTLTWAGTGDVSDLTEYLANSSTDSQVAFAATIAPDGVNPGRYTTSNYTLTTPPPSGSSTGTTFGPYNVVIYQAYAGQLFWLDEDDCQNNTNTCNLTFGVFEQQPTAGLSPIPAPEVTKAKPTVAPATRRAN